MYFPPGITKVNIVTHLNTVSKDLDRGFKFVKKRTAPADASNIRNFKVACEQSTKFRDKSVKRKTASTTTKPTDQQFICELEFPVYQRPDGRLFVRKNGDCSWKHNHPSTVKKLLREGVRDVPEETLDMAKKLLECGNISTSMVKEFVAIESGVQLSDDSLKSLKNQVQMSKFGGQGSKASTGQKLVQMLEERQDCEYIMLTGSYDEAKNLVRVTKKRKKRLMAMKFLTTRQ